MFVKMPTSVNRFFFSRPHIQSMMMYMKLIILLGVEARFDMISLPEELIQHVSMI